MEFTIPGVTDYEVAALYLSALPVLHNVPGAQQFDAADERRAMSQWIDVYGKPVKRIERQP